MPLAFYANDDIRNTSDYSDDGGDGKGAGSTAMRRLRKAVITRFGAQTIDRLKLYVAVPVLKKIEEGQPLEYLSEMRQVKLLRALHKIKLYTYPTQVLHAGAASDVSKLTLHCRFDLALRFSGFELRCKLHVRLIACSASNEVVRTCVRLPWHQLNNISSAVIYCP
jgi:hypothetical protein